MVESVGPTEWRVCGSLGGECEPREWRVWGSLNSERVGH